MNYQEIFNKKYEIKMILLAISSITILFFMVNKSYYDQFEYIKDNVVKRIVLKILLFIFWASSIKSVIYPIMSDKKIIDSNTYLVMDNCCVYQEIIGTGLMGLSKIIIVESNGKQYVLKVAQADGGIEKGDKVKVTYLPNSRYAVIEKEE